MYSRNPRTRKQPIKKKPVSPSLTSLFSSLTQSSSGSNSTVTQESVLWGKHSSSKQGVVKRSTGQHRKSSKKDASHRVTEAEKRPNVFAFMERDGEEDDVVGDLPSDSEMGSLHDFRIPDSFPHSGVPAAPQPPISAGPPALPEGFDQPPSTRPLSFASLHSDSGISIRSSSSERSSPVVPQKIPKKASTDRTKLRAKPMTRGGSSSSAALSSSNIRPAQHQWDGTPESFYPRPAIPEGAIVPDVKSSSKQVSKKMDASKKMQKTKSSKSPSKAVKQDKGGYDLVASSISTQHEEGPKPLYRRFEALNNRILLVLQDEITTMENDLAVMDQRITQVNGPGPTSRRAELRGPTTLEWQRMQLHGMLVDKLNTYNRALASYNALAQLTPTVDDEVQEYRDFLEEYDPLVASETAFLDHLADLATITGTACSQTTADKSALNAGVAILFTIVVFKLVPNILARIIVGAVVVLAMTWAGLLPAAEVTEEGGGQGWGPKSTV